MAQLSGEGERIEKKRYEVRHRYVSGNILGGGGVPVGGPFFRAAAFASLFFPPPVVVGEAAFFGSFGGRKKFQTKGRLRMQIHVPIRVLLLAVTFCLSWLLSNLSTYPVKTAQKTSRSMPAGNALARITPSTSAKRAEEFLRGLADAALSRHIPVVGVERSPTRAFALPSGHLPGGSRGA